MGKKHDFLSPKAISNRIKARGLQKLRWYCQLCQKQCRDENGFKCHQTSESHRRQLELFGQNPGKVIAQYSHQFESDFMAHMRVCHPTAKVSANKVYNEFIRDKNHVHMNSTRWLSLSGFVQYLGSKGLCKIEQGAKGWFMQLIPKDDATDVNRAKRKERDDAEKQDDIRQMREIQHQIKKASELLDDKELHEEDEDCGKMGTNFQCDDALKEPISFTMQKLNNVHPVLQREQDKSVKRQKLVVFEEIASYTGPQDNQNDDDDDDADNDAEDKNGFKSWIRTGIVVKVLSPALKEHGYYRQKGIVCKVIDRFLAEIEMLNSGDIIRVDQGELETVLPAIGGKVLVLCGLYEGCEGHVLGLNVPKCQIQIKLSSLDRDEWFAYEAVSKLHEVVMGKDGQ